MKANKYDLQGFRRHWKQAETEFALEYQDWTNIFSETVNYVSKFFSHFEGGGELPTNCCFLLHSKALNHCLSTYVLLERGLIIDAALTARNALETLLMLELFAKDNTQNHFGSWSKGKRYKPSYIRDRLRKLPSVATGEVIITVEKEYYDDLNFAYDWLCRITHSNFESFQHTVSAEAPKAFKVFIGGSREEKVFFINAIFLALCQTLLLTTVVCCAVFKLTSLEQRKEEFALAWDKIKQTSRYRLTQSIEV